VPKRPAKHSGGPTRGADQHAGRYGARVRRVRPKRADLRNPRPRIPGFGAWRARTARERHAAAPQHPEREALEPPARRLAVRRLPPCRVGHSAPPLVRSRRAHVRPLRRSRPGARRSHRAVRRSGWFSRALGCLRRRPSRLALETRPCCSETWTRTGQTVRLARGRRVPRALERAQSCPRFHRQRTTSKAAIGELRPSALVAPRSPFGRLSRPEAAGQTRSRWANQKPVGKRAPVRDMMHVAPSRFALDHAVGGVACATCSPCARPSASARGASRGVRCRLLGGSATSVRLGGRPGGASGTALALSRHEGADGIALARHPRRE
jgi:hypothetical protein